MKQKRFRTSFLMVLLMVLFTFGLAACEKEAGKEEPTDKVAPAFMGAVEGKLGTITHLAGETVDLLEGVSARDNVDAFDVEITVDKKTYDSENAGTYTVTYTAKDKAGNEATIDRLIVVEESLRATLDVAKIGDSWIEYVFNDTEAFVFTGTDGAKFRTVDKLFIMEKEFFAAEIAAHGSEYPTNGNLPLLPYGSLIVTDSEYNVVHARFQTGVFLQLDVVDGNTVLTHTDVIWNAGGQGGGDLFKDIESLIPEGGYIMFASPQAPQNARIFLVSNYFYSGYQGGAALKDKQDIMDITTVDLDLVEGFEVLIKKPDAIATPEIELERHTISWEAVPNAMGYELYLDGKKHGSLITGTSIDLSADTTIELSTNDGYKVTVKAISKDKFKYSDSVSSNEILYKKIEIQTLAAPEVTADGEILSWPALEGAASYEVYIQLGATNILLSEQTGTTFDATSVRERFNGYNGYLVKAIGLPTHSDSKMSTKVNINQVTTVDVTFGTVKTKAMVVTAETYFLKRNGGFNNTYESFVFIVTGTYEYAGTMTEATSSIVLLDSSYNVKFVRNIIVATLPDKTTIGATYTTEKGWFNDAGYTNQSAQLSNIKDYLAEGDIMIIGKQLGSTLSVQVGDKTPVNANARETVAYAFIAEWEAYPTAPISPAGWRGDFSTFKDAKTIKVTIGTK